MKKFSTLYVGLDVQDTIDIAVAEAGRDGEVRHVGSIGGDLAAVDRALRKLQSTGARLHIVYEAGPCGFVLYRHLATKGIEVEVVSPSSIPRRPGDRIKTDRRDALMLARLARAGEFTAVVVPDAGDEAIRDLVRAREDAVRAQRNVRHQLKALLLRNGVRYAGKTAWTAAHLRWLADLKLTLSGAAAYLPGIYPRHHRKHRAYQPDRKCHPGCRSHLAHGAGGGSAPGFARHRPDCSDNPGGGDWRHRTFHPSARTHGLPRSGAGRTQLRPTAPPGINHQGRQRSRPADADRVRLVIPLSGARGADSAKTGGEGCPGNSRHRLVGPSAVVRPLQAAGGAQAAAQQSRRSYCPRTDRLRLGDHAGGEAAPTLNPNPSIGKGALSTE